MKTFIKYCCLFLFLTNPSMPQWRWMNPTPQGNSLKDVAAIGSGKFISVGNLGTIIRSDEFGNSNKIIDNQYANNLTKIARTPDGTLISVGQYGTILMSNNDGNSWQKINTQFNETFMDVYFINNSTGYIISYEGKIFRTIDGGINWTRQNNPLVSNLYSVSMANENVGYISGNRGLILKTIDGGINWHKLSLFTSANIIKIQAVDENNIFCANASDSLFRSTDGGNSWNYIFTTLYFGFKDIQFTTPEIGFILGSKDVYKTSNGTYFEHVLQTLSSVNLNSIDYYNDSNIFIVGDRGAMLKSTNGGIAWQYISKNIYTSPYNTSPQYIKFINESTGLVINSNNSVYRTTDGGIHWMIIGNNNNYVRNADFFDDEFGVAVGSAGRIYTTSDSGISWTDHSINDSYLNFNAVRILDSDTIITVGFNSSNPIIFRSTNTGNNWNNISLNSSGPLNDVSFWNINDGIVVGDNGTILKTTNSGINWQQIPFVNNHSINTIQCVGIDTLFLLVSGANIYKSTDAGNSFFILPLYITGGIRQIHFKDSNLGIAVGPNGSVFKTTDGGISWTDLSYRSYESVDMIEIISGDKLVVGSNSGNLLMYGDNITSIDDQEIKTITPEYMLYQNYPNPFNPVTTIKYTIPTPPASSPFRKGRNEVGFVTLKVYDILGSEVTTLVNQEQNAGSYEVNFDASKLASGIYFYRLQAGSFVETKKMMVLK